MSKYKILTEPMPSTPIINNSASGAIWQLRPASERAIITLMQREEIPEILARILVNRGVETEDAADFLNPTLRSFLPDPYHFLDMDKAVKRIVSAIKNKEKIAIFGDYDVDGATSSSLLGRFFKMLGAEYIIYIPDRIKEGYGPNTNAMLALKEQGAVICITVDCGTLAFEPIAEASKSGLDVIVIDHHLGDVNLPDAVAIVNPNRLDETSEHRHLAAVGMAFMLLVAINKSLREEGFYSNIKEPDLREFLDIVALGTVCDVVSLTGVNRALVSQGLKIMRARKNIGIKALSDIAAIDETPSVYHLGFVLGPRINAGGRVGEAGLGAQLLLTENVDEAYEIAQKLDVYNAERKAIEQQVQEEAIAQVEENNLSNEPVIIVKGQGWHSGVIGIVAGRLKERYHRPVAVIAIENGIGKASARSISGIDFGAAVVSATAENLLIAGGGHAMAAGFSVAEEKIPHLQEFFAKRFAPQIEENGTRILKLDAYINPSAVTPDLVKKIQQAGPFGSGNPQPKFILSDIYIIRADIIKEKHIRCIVTEQGGGSGRHGLKCMAFNAMETPLADILLNANGRKIHLAGTIRINLWQGMETAEFFIEDAAAGDL